jgi:hypothetical protein
MQSISSYLKATYPQLDLSAALTVSTDVWPSACGMYSDVYRGTAACLKSLTASNANDDGHSLARQIQALALDSCQVLAVKRYRMHLEDDLLRSLLDVR